jgi:hypothetical protein
MLGGVLSQDFQKLRAAYEAANDGDLEALVGLFTRETVWRGVERGFPVVAQRTWLVISYACMGAFSRVPWIGHCGRRRPRAPKGHRLGLDGVASPPG